MLQSLLTDPRIQEEDYLFFDGDPCEGPQLGQIITSKINKASHQW